MRGFTIFGAGVLVLASACQWMNEARDDDVLRAPYEDEITVDIASGGVDMRVIEAQAVLEPVGDGEASGVFSLGTEDEGVQLVGSVRGLDPDDAITVRIHERGDCSSPDGPGAPIAGEGLEMDGLAANDEGRAALRRVVPGASLGDGGPQDLSGRALVVRDAQDGTRLACGVIRAAGHG